MKQSKTKKALAMSMLSMVLCIAMLVGMTFAWFTDTASTSVNKIQAGKLDVALEMWDGEKWVPAEGETLNFVKAEAGKNETILWEPGCTYELQKVRIVNGGNLALKYKVVFSAVSGDTELAEVLDVYMNDQPVKVNGKQATLKDVLTSTDPDGFAHGNLLAETTSDDITISIHMQETAGNGYQGLAINGVAITVLATQDTVEYDSYDNQYDKDANAEYIVEVSNIEELRAAVKENVGAKIVLTNDITIGDDELEVVDTAKNAKGMLLINKNTVIDLNGKTLAYTGGTNDSCWYIFYVKDATLTIIDSSGDNSGKVYGNDPDGTWAVMIREAVGGTVNIYGGHYMSKDGAPVYTNDGDINIYGGIFETENHQNQLLNIGNGYTGSMKIYGGSFKTFEPGVTNGGDNIKVADGYKVVQNGDWYTVVPKTETSVTSDTTLDMEGRTITLTDVEEPYVLTSDNKGAKITLKNATYTGEAQGIYFGEYIGSTEPYNFNTQADNVTVKDLKVSTNITNGSNKISAGVWVYGKFELNNCKMSGTTTTAKGCTPYDAIFVNYSKGTVNGGEYGSMFVYTHSEVALKGVKVDKIACMTNTAVGKALTIDKDCKIDTIEFVGSDSYVMNIVIEDGATIGKIIYKGTTYTVDQWNSYVASI